MLSPWQQVLPVKSVEHLYGNKHRKSHGGGVTWFKDLTVNTLKHGVFFCTLHKVPLQTRKRRFRVNVGQYQEHHKPSRVSSSVCFLSGTILNKKERLCFSASNIFAISDARAVRQEIIWSTDGSILRPLRVRCDIRKSSCVDHPVRSELPDTEQLSLF